MTPLPVKRVCVNHVLFFPVLRLLCLPEVMPFVISFLLSQYNFPLFAMCVQRKKYFFIFPNRWILFQLSLLLNDLISFRSTRHAVVVWRYRFKCIYYRRDYTLHGSHRGLYLKHTGELCRISLAFLEQCVSDDAARRRGQYRGNSCSDGMSSAWIYWLRASLHMALFPPNLWVTSQRVSK